MMESQIETMRGSIAALKTKPKDKKKKEKREKAVAIPSSSKPAKLGKGVKKKGKKSITENDVLTFEQKKALSESIGQLDGAKLEKVIQIIHEGVPEIKDVRASLHFLLLSFVERMIYHVEHGGN